MKKNIRIATRTSQLALWQAYYVRDKLQSLYQDLEVEIIEIVSQGDKTLDIPLSTVGGKGLFLKELEVSLLEGKSDIAVHSMKDVTVELPAGLEITVICPREDPRDAFVSNNFSSIHDLPKGAVIGTCSLRRRCQIKANFPHLEVKNLRGNVNTRLGRLDNGDYDALVLAASGLIRLEFQHRIAQFLPTNLCLPAVGQGAVGIECRQDDLETNALIASLGDRDATLRVTAERAANAKLGGGCHVPVAVFSELINNKMTIRGMVGECDGSKVLTAQSAAVVQDVEQAIAIGEDVAADLIKQGAKEILASVYEENG